jgi:hypothetical protein
MRQAFRLAPPASAPPAVAVYLIDCYIPASEVFGGIGMRPKRGPLEGQNDDQLSMVHRLAPAACTSLA